MNIYETICNVMSDIGVVSKDKENTQGNKFKYRGIDDVMNALSPAMIKNKLFVVPNVLEHSREERITKSGSNMIYSICKVQYTFYADDGTHVDCTVIGEAFDSGDKATNKAMSTAYKYACFQTFCIPTEEMKDPDAETHESSFPTIITSETLLNLFKREIERTGKPLKYFLNLCKVEKIEDMERTMLEQAIEGLSKYPNKK